MDGTHEIVAEAATVTEARQQAERRVPRGMQVLAVKENWPHTGTARAAGEAAATAQELARAQVPVGAAVVSESVLEAGAEVSVYAADAQDASDRLRATYGDAVDGVISHLRRDGELVRAQHRLPEGTLDRSGFVLYKALLLRPFAEVSYRAPARVALTFGPATRRRSRHA
jgi:hypothetical protein